MNNSVDYEYWHDFLYREGAVCAPSQLHGVICASVTTGDANWARSALEVLDIPGEDASTALHTAIEALREIVAKTLADDNYGLALLLPDDALSIAQRGDALAEWCQGYLYGMGQCGQSPAQPLGDEGKEALEDIARIAELDTDLEDSDANDSDYVQLVEFVRIAVISIFNSLNPDSVKSATRH